MNLHFCAMCLLTLGLGTELTDSSTYWSGHEGSCLNWMALVFSFLRRHRRAAGYPDQLFSAPVHVSNTVSLWLSAPATYPKRQRNLVPLVWRGSMAQRQSRFPKNGTVAVAPVITVQNCKGREDNTAFPAGCLGREWRPVSWASRLESLLNKKQPPHLLSNQESPHIDWEDTSLGPSRLHHCRITYYLFALRVSCFKVTGYKTRQATHTSQRTPQPFSGDVMAS